MDDAALAVLLDWRRRRRSAASEGLGLGLYLAKRIISAHGGRLEIESSAGSGTLVRVVLPR